MQGSFSFSITSIKLDFQEINFAFDLEPSSIIKKGTIVSKTVKIEAPYDIWRYEVKFNNDIELYNSIEKLLLNLEPATQQIYEFCEKYEVKLSCYLRSEFSQMGLEFSPRIISAISKLGLGFEIHILSFGGIEE